MWSNTENTRIKKEFRIENFLSPSQIIVMGFMTIILVGSILLKLPISLQDGVEIEYVDSLFISTSAVCVVGLFTKIPAYTFSNFGQFVLVCLVQIGGLGFMTFVTSFMAIIGKKMMMKDQMILAESFSVSNMSDIVRVTKKIFIFTVIAELTGALLFAIVFLGDFPMDQALKFSLFHSVSAFCNAGFDLLGAESLIPYQNNVIINFTAMGLIVTGGIGFFVIRDVAVKLREGLKEGHSLKHIIRSFNLHTKIVLTTTAILIISGTLLIFIFEGENVATIGKMNLFEKLLVSMFQSVTARTAGFNTIDLTKTTEATNFIYMILMFIGGAPSGTAGGVKVTTIAVIALTCVAIVKDSSKTQVFYRRVSNAIVRRAIALFFLAIAYVCTGTIVLLITDNLTLLQAVFITISAFGTVGSDMGVISILSEFGKVILIILMFVGRLGVFTFTMSMMITSVDNGKDNISYPEEKVILG